MEWDCRYHGRQAWIANRKSVEKKLLTFKLPAIVKPNTLAASLGIDESSIIWNTDDFGKIIDQRFQSFPHLTEILIESYLNDATEYTVSITGNTGRYLFNVSKLKSKTQHHALHSYNSKLTISEKRDFTYVIEDNRGVLYDCIKMELNLNLYPEYWDILPLKRPVYTHLHQLKC